MKRGEMQKKNSICGPITIRLNVKVKAKGNVRR